MAPSSSIVSPGSGATIAPGGTVVIQGTAADTGGGRVGAVEVSVDGGTWHPATGRESWRYTWTPSAAGQVTLRSRAADDSGNLGSETAVTVSVGGTRSCPCSLFGNAPVDLAGNDNMGSIEAGIRFRADDDGFITALRYYRRRATATATWSGTRTGHLWTNTGTLLGSATFIGDSLPGWHEAVLPSPVAVAKDTTYVASYLSSDGSYSVRPGLLTNTFDAAPLHAPASAGGSPNGMFKYGGGFPDEGFAGASYGADVLFTHGDQTPPTVTAVSPADDAVSFDQGTRVTASLQRAARPDHRRRRDRSSCAPPAAPRARRRHLQRGHADGDPDAAGRAGAPAAYSAIVKGGAGGVHDASGNPLAHDRTWSFTTALSSRTEPRGRHARVGVQRRLELRRLGIRKERCRVQGRAAREGDAADRARDEGGHGERARRLSAQRPQLPGSPEPADRRPDRRDQDADGDRRQDEDLQAEAQPRRAQQPAAQAVLKATTVAAVRDRAGKQATSRTPTLLLAPKRH